MIVHIGYFYILFSLACYSSLGVLHKVAEVKSCRAEAISILMCVWSLVILIVLDFSVGRSLYAPAHIAVLALPFGVCAGIAILALQSALSLGNISTSWLAVNLSAGIPTVLSILLYHEPISILKLGALAAMGVAMVLLWKDSQLRKSLVVETADA